MSRTSAPHLFSAVAAGLILVVTSCSTGRSTNVGPVRVLDPAVRAYLMDPGAGVEDIPSAARGSAQDIYRVMIGGDLTAARGALDTAAPFDDRLQRLLQAQLAFAEGDLEGSRAALGDTPVGDAGLLLSARLHELAGRPGAAAREYWPIRRRFSVADQRLQDLLPSAISAREVDFESGLANRDPRRAGEALADLEEWAPESPSTRRAAVRLARFRDDPDAELSAWRKLARTAAPSREEMFNWAELELTNGDTDQALEVARALVSGEAGDARAQELLTRAEFAWRSRLLPDKAQRVLGSPVLTRAELALALYWYFPQARYAPSRQVRIASDILEHPYREEIAQIVNAGLLEVDPAGHRFRPDAATTRTEALTAVADLMRQGGATCAAGGAAGSCSLLERCGVVDPAQCQAAGGISGAEFGTWTRRAQERLTRP